MITDKFDSSIVLKAISTIAKTNNPKEFAINNEVVYDVAVEAVRIMRNGPKLYDRLLPRQHCRLYQKN